jgi:hypothetical protein
VNTRQPREKAAGYFNAMIREGEKKLNQGSDIDFIAKFGERKAENEILSNAYLLKVLGNKGLGDKKSAIDCLGKALELSASNLLAKVEIKQFRVLPTLPSL